jgi:hypothetical protein
MAWLILVTITWGALAFGAVYEWARWPLLAGCSAAGVWGFVRRVPRERRAVNRPVLLGVALVAAAVIVQLVPVESRTIQRWSPATHEFLKQYDLRYALPTVEDLFPGSNDPGLHPDHPTEPGARVLFSGTISHPLSIDPPKTWAGLSCLAGFGLMLLGLARGLGGRDLRILTPGLITIGVVLSLIGIIQRALWSGRVYGFWEPINKDVNAFGPFINRNHFAGWMLMALPVAIGYVVSLSSRDRPGPAPGWRSRLIWLAAPETSRTVLSAFGVVVMALALALTLSRSGIACFALAVLLSGIQVLRRQRSTTRGRLLALYLAGLIGIALAWTGVDAVGARFAQVDWTLSGRAGAWEDAWRIHRAFPWFGTGLGTYGTATLLYQRFEAGVAHYVQAHNDYLQLLVDGGWLVALPALLLIGLFAREVRRRFREALDDRTGYWLRLGAVTGIVAIAFQEIVEFSLQMPGNAALFTVLCAMAVRRATVKHHDRKP